MSTSGSVGSPLVGEWRELLARHARVNEALERELQRKHRLSVTEFEALQRLAEKDANGCRLQQLVDDVHMSQSALSRLIGRLHDEGLVDRRSCSEDRRGIYACITDAGRARLAEAEPTQAEVLERTLGAGA
ncbi:MAG: transcriptional regulator, MarR family [Solirubrobacterales bacterium]|nr:transcriptional regulator, MarR family [Solirubrobacterales bacterium]